MVHKIIFYPVGNGDTSQIILSNGKRLLFDFYKTEKSEDSETPSIDVAEALKKELKQAKRADFDVVAFSHADMDHIQGAADFFYLEHALKYQSEDRIRIKELWVPAAMVLEERNDDSRVIRQEARYRLQKGKGIKVFSCPGRLEKLLTQWVDEGKIASTRKSEILKTCVVDAGQIVPGFNLGTDDVEFFVHSPFVKTVGKENISTNEAALILHATFDVCNSKTRYFIIGDAEADILKDIVEITLLKGNEERLMWDIYNIPHHCSYLALNSKDKGVYETPPLEAIRKLLNYGNKNCYLISSSNKIEDCDQKQPPHIQAYKAYDKHCKNEKSLLRWNTPTLNDRFR